MSDHRLGYRTPLLCAVGALLATGCSIGVLPVDPSRVRSAQRATQPLERGPDAPGAHRNEIRFARDRALLFDPRQIELTEDRARLRPVAEGAGFATERDLAVIETKTAIPYVALDHFTETTGPEHRGVIRYQLSNGGGDWRFYDGQAWVRATLSAQQANTADEVDRAIPTFHRDAASGDLLLRAFLISPTGKEPVALSRLMISTISPRMDGWD